MMSRIESVPSASAHDRLSAPESERSNGFIVVISGPSGVGKDTAVNGLLDNNPDLDLKRLVTYTTRGPRPGEVEGADYHFVSIEDFHRLDLAEKKQYGSSWKGTPRAPFLNVFTEGERLLWRIDPSRAALIKEFYDEAFGTQLGTQLNERTLAIYLGISRLSLLKERVRSRAELQGLKFDSTEFLQRLKNEDYPQWQANEASFPHVVMNDGTVEETVGEIVSLIKTSFSLAPSDI